ncbi:MAG: DNA photolyase [Desulfobacteraceae bacterium]|nr:DNA photolyase [Desulfobacteraceae bacterium]MCF8094203.1 DNA photolyase [Desulfobacteraceae bacterium]
MKISKIYIDASAEDDPLARQIPDRLGVPVDHIGDPAWLYKGVAKAPDPESAGKSVLLLTRNKGSFIRNCPGTSHYTCCGYRILHIGAYCSMDCAYCILQAYYHPPVLQFFTNQGQMYEELDGFFAEGHTGRIGTGEFTDSLIWERVFPIARYLVNYFSGQDTAILELKTKTAAVDSLPQTGHCKKTIMAWSLNTESVIREQERSTASLESRIAAAEKVQANGYPLAFHFDPMILYPGCHQDYAGVADRLFSRIDPSNIVWISLGSFRFMPELKEVAARRFPDSGIVYGEFIKALDGKMRYFKPLRIRLYRSLIERIREKAPGVLLYFCMEDQEVWEKALGYTPEAYGGLSRMLDMRAEKMCGLKRTGQ